MTALRFGIAGASSLRSLDELVDVLRRGEAAGFTSIQANDHLHSHLAPLPVLAAAAVASPTMTLGTLVLANDFRHPLMLAKEAATLDTLSGGRVELGLGAGWADDDYHQLAMTKAPAPERIARLEAAIEVMRAAWRGEAFSRPEDSHYPVQDVRGTPVIDREIPICIGGGGPKVLDLAGRVADIVGINLNFAAGVQGREMSQTGTLDHTRQRIAWVQAAAADAGRTVELQMRVHVAAVTTGESRDGLVDLLVDRMGLDHQQLAESPHNLIGSTDEIVDKIGRYAAEHGLTYWVIPHEAIDAFAPVIDQLAGRRC